MAINATTLTGAITAQQTQIGVNSATGITAPVSTTGSGLTYLYCEAELMQVTAVSGTFISVVRGVYGTQAAAHVNSSIVIAGLVTDFPLFTPSITAFTAAPPNRFVGVSVPVAAAAVLAPSGPLFHVTGTTASSSMSLPPNFVEGTIRIIADGIWTWTSTTAAQGFAQAGTVTSGGTSVDFTYDANTALWYASRVS